MGKDAVPLAADTWELIVKRRHTQHENWQFYGLHRDWGEELKNKLGEYLWRSEYAPAQWRVSLDLEERSGL